MTQHTPHRCCGFPHMVHLGVLLLVALTVSIMAAGRSMAAPAPTTIVDKCRADLATRLKLPVDEVKLLKSEATTWPNAGLGLPEVGKVYAQVQTPGWGLALQAREQTYMYTAGKNAIRYGGPAQAWLSSVLFVEPVADEPNLNGDLYQCSMLGTNPVKIISGVSEYYPQANGMMLVTRRTSRSSYDLLLVKAGEGDKAKTLYSSFYIGAAALNGKGDAWAAITRPRVGGGWQVVVSPVGKDDARITLPMPNGVMPEQLAWLGDKLLMLVSKDNKLGCFETTPFANAPAWKATIPEAFPGLPPYMLNKSETLEVTQAGTAKNRPWKWRASGLPAIARSWQKSMD